MSDFNQNDSLTSGQHSTEQEDSRPSRKKLSSDELIALFLAFTGIGSILFWSLRTSPVNFDALNTGTPSATIQAGQANSTAAATADAAKQASSEEKSDVKVANVNPNIANPNTASIDETPIVPTTANPSVVSATQVGTPKNEAGDIKANQPEGEKSSVLVDPKVPIAAGAITKITESKTEAPQGTIQKPGNPKIFSDIPDNYWAKPAIAALSSRGIIDGFRDGTFKPNEPINRAQFAGMIQKAFAKPTTKDAIKFTDIKVDYWANSSIEEATRTGFMSGYPNGTFKPEQAIPKVELISAIITGLGLKPQGDPIQTLAKYKDAENIPKWAIPKISSAVETGIILPNVIQLEPEKVATRADAASYLYQALVKEGSIKP